MTRRERPAWRSMLGMIFTARPPKRPSEASSRRWKLTGRLPWSSIASWNAPSVKLRAQPSLLVVAQAQQEHLAQQVRQLVGRRVGVALDLGRGVRSLEAGLVDHEVDRVVDADLAAVKLDVKDDPAGSPDGVGVHHHPVLERRVEALLAHHLLAVHGPALDELRRVDEHANEARVVDWRRTAAGDGRDRPRGCDVL